MTRRIAVLGACALSAGLLGCIATQVNDLGNGRYLMQGGGGAFHSGPQITQEMITKAHAYCAARGQRAVIDLDNQIQKDGVYQNYGFGVTRVEKAHGQVTFECEGGGNEVGAAQRPKEEPMRSAPAPAASYEDTLAELRRDAGETVPSSPPAAASGLSTAPEPTIPAPRDAIEQEFLRICMRQWTSNFTEMRSCYVAKIASYREMTTAPVPAKAVSH